MKWVVIIILILLFDRVEFLYYALDNPEAKIGFLTNASPIRIDSYIYFASLRVQYIIFAIVINLILVDFRKETTLYLIASILYFIEYFLTYNESIYTLPLGIPVSIATVKLICICNLIYSIIKHETVNS